MANYLTYDNFYDDIDVMHCRFSLKSDKLLKLVNNRVLKHIANNLQNILNNESFYIFYVTFQKINTFLPTKRTLLQDNPKNQMNSLRKWSVNCMKESCNGVKGKIGGGRRDLSPPVHLFWVGYIPEITIAKQSFSSCHVMDTNICVSRIFEGVRLNSEKQSKYKIGRFWNLIFFLI